MDADTAWLLLTHLVSLNSPREQLSLRPLTRPIVCYSLSTNLRQSSIVEIWLNCVSQVSVKFVIVHQICCPKTVTISWQIICEKDQAPLAPPTAPNAMCKNPPGLYQNSQSEPGGVSDGVSVIILCFSLKQWWVLWTRFKIFQFCIRFNQAHIQFQSFQSSLQLSLLHFQCMLSF